MFGWPRKSWSTSRSSSDFCVNRGYGSSLQVYFLSSSFFMFLRSRNPFFEVSQSYHVRVTSKIQINFWFCRYSRVYWYLGLMEFRNFFIPYVFEVNESIFTVSGSYHVRVISKIQVNSWYSSVLIIRSHAWIFVFFLIPPFSRSRNQFSAVSCRYNIRVTSKLQVNLRFHGCSRVLMIKSYKFS